MICGRLHFDACMCVLVFVSLVSCVHLLDSVASRYWNVESGEVELVSGQGHTNMIASLQATPNTLYSMGMDKYLKSFQTATNEFE